MENESLGRLNADSKEKSLNETMLRSLFYFLNQTLHLAVVFLTFRYSVRDIMLSFECYTPVSHIQSDIDADVLFPKVVF